MNRSELKNRAKETIKQKRWLCVLVAFIVSVVSNPAGFLPTGPNITFENGTLTMGESASVDFSQLADQFGFGSALIIFLTVCAALLVGAFAVSVIKCGGIRFFLKHRKKYPVEVDEVIENFKDKTFINMGFVSLKTEITIMLWSFLFIIPGIYATYTYAAIPYILAVRPDVSFADAKNISKKVMDGHRMDLFVLELSFIGWDLLSSLTANIVGIVYVYPYKLATLTEFFSEIREEAILAGEITPFDFPDYAPYSNQPIQTTPENANYYYTEPEQSYTSYTSQEAETLHYNEPASPSATDISESGEFNDIPANSEETNTTGDEDNNNPF